MPKFALINTSGLLVGSFVEMGAEGAPPFTLPCDGSAVSRTTYAKLFSIIGTRYGYGDGSTTFNLPDARGRFLRVRDNGAGRDPDAGSRTASNTGGATGDSVGSVQNDQVSLHSHNINHDHPAGNTASGGSHAHSSASATAAGNHGHYTFKDVSISTYSHLTSSNYPAKELDGGGFTSDYTIAGQIAEADSGLTSNQGNHTHPVNVPSTGSDHLHGFTTPQHLGSSGSHGGNESRSKNMYVDLAIVYA